MNKNNIYFSLAFILIYLFIPCSAIAQLSIINNSLEITQTGLVHVEGDVIYDSGTIGHNGIFQLTGNWFNRAKNNDKAFTAASAGNVIFIGGLQTINGTTTRFPQLSLSGTNKKVLNVNTEANFYLNLNDRELDVNGYDMLVNNNEGRAITRSSGFVNTSEFANGTKTNGRLIRSVSPGVDYLFPLGAIVNNNRYRPLSISSNQSGFIGGQFLNYSATFDSYPVYDIDQSLKGLNEKFYHTVSNISNIKVELKINIPFNTSADGDFNDLGRWNASINKWAKPVSPTSLNSQSGEETNKSILYEKVQMPFTELIPLVLANVATIPDDFKIPNVITPNGDGKNDQFVIRGIEKYSGRIMTIFNRWGNSVYESGFYKNDWDGNGLSDGTYYYLLKLRDDNGAWKTYTGYITLLRRLN
ncbi:gliding motility-associated-like protein [Pedobacter cryoconitis]|uniref:Gliding motility-associated-like protein n=2 Tax=Pedobacter cryoconitis TaxID=188932 RepID=A0A327RYW0_9SPHI|nr:gliding motility-associated-like protein [Pedobacter cryoconitis]